LSTSGDPDRQPPANVKAVVMADMLFASRVRGVARALGVEVRLAGDVAGVTRALHDSGANLVIVDLELPAGKGIEAIRALRVDPDSCSVNVVGFSSHRNTLAIEAGRQAGADRVMARSAFVTSLPALLDESAR